MKQPPSAVEVRSICARKQPAVSLDAGAYCPAGWLWPQPADLLVMSEQFYQGLFGRDENYEKTAYAWPTWRAQGGSGYPGKPGMWFRLMQEKGLHPRGVLPGTRSWDTTGRGCFSRRVPVCLFVSAHGPAMGHTLDRAQFMSACPT